VTDKERIEALVQLARDIIEMYEAAQVKVIHYQHKFNHSDDMEQFSLMHALDGYRAEVVRLQGSEECSDCEECLD
jgi:hypothetical protein